MLPLKLSSRSASKVLALIVSGVSAAESLSTFLHTEEKKQDWCPFFGIQPDFTNSGMDLSRDRLGGIGIPRFGSFV